ncbi:Protein LIKE COV 3 [Glycine soja]
MSSWLGTLVLTLGEWFIKKMALVRYLYVASTQISATISPDQSSNAFKEVSIIRHPHVGEYALGFITSSMVLRNIDEKEIFCVYIPTNHLYLGDIYLISLEDILRPNLSVREAIDLATHNPVKRAMYSTIVPTSKENKHFMDRGSYLHRHL